MDDDADDISLLAALAEEHPEEVKVEKEEEEEEIDYLEGITPDMFDKSLVERSVWNAAAARDSKQGGRELLLEEEEEEEEEGVEPLPDGHYGLLGSGAAGLLVPRGRLQDLPEEVLRQILLLLPARDLYRCVAPVCTSWRSIVQDPKVRTSSPPPEVTLRPDGLFIFILMSVVCCLSPRSLLRTRSSTSATRWGRRAPWPRSRPSWRAGESWTRACLRRAFGGWSRKAPSPL